MTGRPSFGIWSLQAETASDLQGSPTGAMETTS